MGEFGFYDDGLGGGEASHWPGGVERVDHLAVLAEQERRLHHIAQGEDGTMAAGAQLAGDGQQRHHVAEAAAHFPSHQNLGHGPIPGCRRRRRVAPFDRSWRQSAPAAYPSGLREDVAAAKH